MKLDDLKEENLVEILRIYEELCSGGISPKSFREVMYKNPETVLEELKRIERGSYEEYAVVSKWETRSKIFFERDFNGNIAVKFNPNFGPEEREGPEYEEAEKSGAEFVKAAMKYLNEH